VRAPERLADREAEAGEAESPRRVRERDLEGHFTQEEAAPPEGGEAPEGASRYGDDVQLGRAVEVLKSWTYFDKLNRGRGGASVQAMAPQAPSAEAR